MDVDRKAQGDLEFGDAEGVEKMATRAFFDRWLRGNREGRWEDTPTVFYYHAFDAQEGKRGVWVSADRWPGAETKTVSWFLHAGGRIGPGEPGEATEKNPLSRKYRYDPKDPSPTLGGLNLPPLPRGPTDQSALEKRDDVLVYSTDPLKEPLRVLGNVKVTLSFAVNRVDADFSVRLCDVHPDGRSTLVHDGIQRAKFRAGPRPRRLEPGKPTAVTVTLPKTAYTFARGHACKILVSSSNHPRFERNPHTGSDHWDPEEALDLEVTVFHDRDRPSRVEIPVRTDSRDSGD
jgi:putative CocE/NonD family hydrolase